MSARPGIGREDRPRPLNSPFRATVTMPSEPHRNMTMADGMILIAALAIGFALVRMTLPVKDGPPRVVVILT